MLQPLACFLRSGGRRCPPEYLATLEEPLQDIEDWTCMTLDRECDEDDDLMDDDELWDGRVRWSADGALRRSELPSSRGARESAMLASRMRP